MERIPLLLPARRKAAMDLMIPKMSCDNIGMTFPCEASGRRSVSLEPEATAICCSFVPEN